MKEMIEISMIAPKQLKILVSRQLLEEFAKVVKEQDFSTTITEALSEELKKLRFRRDLEKVRSLAQ